MRVLRLACAVSETAAHVLQPAVHVTAQTAQQQQPVGSQAPTTGQQGSPAMPSSTSAPTTDIIARAKLGAMSVLEKINQVRTAELCYKPPKIGRKELDLKSELICPSRHCTESLLCLTCLAVLINSHQLIGCSSGTGPKGKGIGSHEGFWYESG